MTSCGASDYCCVGAGYVAATVGWHRTVFASESPEPSTPDVWVSAWVGVRLH